LHAQVNCFLPGVYDCIIKDGTLEHKANAVRTAQCHDFNVRSNECFQDCNLLICEYVNIVLEGGYWTDRLLVQGFSEFDVVFRSAVLEPVPITKVDCGSDTRFWVLGCLGSTNMYHESVFYMLS